MRVSVPTLPQALLSRASTENLLPIPEVVERVADFLRPGNVAILTGAGVSVDSGIRAYRGSDGRYMNPNYKYVAMRISLFVECTDPAMQTYILP